MPEPASNGRLDRAVEQLLEDGHGVFVEVSAHPVLTMTLSGVCEAKGAVVLGSLQRERGGLSQLRRGLAELHVQGQSVDWKRLLSPAGGQMIQLPTYAFQRQRYWVEVSPSRKDAYALGLSSVQHPMLGALTALADNDGYILSGLLAVRACVVEGYAVHGTVLMPGTGMLELALFAARTVGLGAVVELTLEQPLVLSEPVAVQLQALDRRAGRGR